MTSESSQCIPKLHQSMLKSKKYRWDLSILEESNSKTLKQKRGVEIGYMGKILARILTGSVLRF